MTVSESSSRDGLPRRQPGNRIFIVHADYDQDLAQALKDLLIAWGFDAFFGRQEIRQLGDPGLYRHEIADLVRKADFVILILSNAFRHSFYCQAEAGATIVDDLPQIPILVPPVSRTDYTQISPVTRGQFLIDGSTPGFTTRLRRILQEELTDVGMPDIHDRSKAEECQEAAETALADLVGAYSIMPPSAVLTGTWSKGLTDASEASASIIAHIRRAVAEGETNVAVAGVSLKFSINILTAAISSLAGHRSDRLQGPLNIELTHVDDQAHVLYSIEDPSDINSVFDYFRVGWADRRDTWAEAGRRAGIVVNVAEPAAIDYIPQEVGIRIESVAGRWSVLFAGQCSFEKTGSSGKYTHLRVGEGEYAFYTAALPNPYASALDKRGANMIDVFDQYIRHYSNSAHNDGATVVTNHTEWIQRLERCVAQYEGVDDLLLFSNTGTKLLPLVVPALERRWAVRFYTTHPDLLTPEEAPLVRSLKEDLKIEPKSSSGDPASQRAELFYLRRLPTFRAALIGDAALGLEPYVPQQNSDDAPATKTLLPSGLKLIVTKYSAHFRQLRALIEDQCSGAELAG